MKVAQVSRPGGQWEVVEREIPAPGRGQVRIKVEACGICHGDSLVKEGHWPGLQYPRVPGHEVAGLIDAVGEQVTRWKKGDRVGVGWHGGHCFHCGPCRRGDFKLCQNAKVTGISFDGGYAEYLVAPDEAVASLPEELSFAQAAPLMCAGITVFNALRNSGAGPGDVVAIQGIGGLGHLGIQFAVKMGFHTVAIGRRKDKEPLAKKLGAKFYIDSEAGDPAEPLKRLGGARVILATAPDSKAISGLVNGLAPNGEIIIVAAPAEPLQISAISLILGKRSISGWASGTAHDSEAALKFSVLSGIEPLIETFSLAKVAEAYEQMHSGKVRFRAVLTM